VTLAASPASAIGCGEPVGSVCVIGSLLLPIGAFEYRGGMVE